jgi:hypothetical protein
VKIYKRHRDLPINSPGNGPVDPSSFLVEPQANILVDPSNTFNLLVETSSIPVDNSNLPVGLPVESPNLPVDSSTPILVDNPNHPVNPSMDPPEDTSTHPVESFG